jgi:hypothetical protein
MKTAFILAIASGAVMVGAQSSTSSASSATHTVKVGSPVGQHHFEPNQINATIGDIIGKCIALLLLRMSPEPGSGHVKTCVYIVGRANSVYSLRDASGEPLCCAHGS